VFGEDTCTLFVGTVVQLMIECLLWLSIQVMKRASELELYEGDAYSATISHAQPDEAVATGSLSASETAKLRNAASILMDLMKDQQVSSSSVVSSSLSLPDVSPSRSRSSSASSSPVRISTRQSTRSRRRVGRLVPPQYDESYGDEDEIFDNDNDDDYYDDSYAEPLPIPSKSRDRSTTPLPASNVTLRSATEMYRLAQHQRDRERTTPSSPSTSPSASSEDDSGGYGMKKGRPRTRLSRLTKRLSMTGSRSTDSLDSRHENKQGDELKVHVKTPGDELQHIQRLQENLQLEALEASAMGEPTPVIPSPLLASQTLPIMSASLPFMPSQMLSSVPPSAVAFGSVPVSVPASGVIPASFSVAVTTPASASDNSSNTADRRGSMSSSLQSHSTSPMTLPSGVVHDQRDTATPSPFSSHFASLSPSPMQTSSDGALEKEQVNMAVVSDQGRESESQGTTRPSFAKSLDSEMALPGQGQEQPANE